MDDVRKFAVYFPWDLIPHITENNEVNDIIHNYKGTIQATAKKEQTRASLLNRVLPPNELIHKNPKLALEQKKPSIRNTDLDDAKQDLKRERVARMIGLVAHLVYWNVFGDRLNPLPLDAYHKKLLFIQIA